VAGEGYTLTITHPMPRDGTLSTGLVPTEATALAGAFREVHLH